ncbi:HAD family hydrolase [Streptomyces candidus]|uniref:HAD superfamily hydrolase (TIGR01509 family) n=1 Tax=Streptomyces candidus TaxID=67283 RepID=A0A7X0HHY4_9ACTN|nr:HAD family phosphatase [Streptomyces candidus]MBB6437823.1 HAD superfamily hydrolase (TIGR01509 family) [Streptomyces candidus]GHH50081.1 hydrolase [Streptomyces candidus]
MSTPRPLSVIFDLDGTLVDSEPNYYAAERRLLARHGVPDFGWEEHARFIGIGTRETLEALRGRYGIAAGVDELLAENNRLYLESARASTEVFPEMRKLVERLHAGDVAMAVASGSSREAIEAVLAGTGLDAYLGRVVVSAEEVARGKPAPDVFLAAAAALAAEPGHCVVFEDAAPGVAAAFAAGMRCVAIPYVRGSENDPAFGTAELLFPGGQVEFTADGACAWLGL